MEPNQIMDVRFQLNGLEDSLNKVGLNNAQ